MPNTNTRDGVCCTPSIGSCCGPEDDSGCCGGAGDTGCC